MRWVKKWWQKLALILIFSVICGCLVEFGYEGIARYKMISQGQDTIIEGVDWDKIEAEGAVSEEGALRMVDIGKLVIDLQGKYVDKLIYQYTSEEDFAAIIQLEIKDVYGNYRTKVINDYSTSNLSASVVNIKGVVNKIVINLPYDVTITNVSINNQLNINKYRILYVSLIACLLLCLYVFKAILRNRPDIIFLMISMVIGGMLIVLSPPRFMSWDEHIHFRYTFFDCVVNGESSWTEAEDYMYYHPEAEGGMPFVSKEEKAMQIQYLNNADDIVLQKEKYPFWLASVGYFHMAFAVRICRALGVSFYNTLMIGRFANLTLYCVLIAYAIRCIPYLKRTLMTMCLMPTPILLASSYSYDTLITSTFVLGISLLLREFYYLDKQMKIKDGFLILLCFTVGSFPKAIYIPMILSFLLLPSSKFKSKRSEWIWKSIPIILFVLLMLTFVIPSTSGNMEGDSRGGNTDVTMQMELIFSHPVAYIKVLLNNIFDKFDEYVLGRSSLAYFAYEGYHKMYTAVTVIMVAVFFTEPRVMIPQNSKKSIRNLKVIMMILVAGVVGLIWTALYLSFTEVGMEKIAGVQARYYLPLMLPVLITLYSDKIKIGWKAENYNLFISFCIIALWNISLYSHFLISYCN